MRRLSKQQKSVLRKRIERQKDRRIAQDLRKLTEVTIDRYLRRYAKAQARSSNVTP